MVTPTPDASKSRFLSALLLAALMLFNRTALAEVVINEIMYHPATENVAEEFIELLNTGGVPVDLIGWQISRGVSFSLPPVTLGPGDFLVVAADPSVFANLYPGVTNVVGGWDGILSNRGETLQLLDGSGLEIDRVRYADEGEWAERRRGEPDYGHRGWTWRAAHDGDGFTAELIHPGLPRNTGQNWAPSRVSGGTPGMANSVASANLPPMIVDVQHIPPLPRSMDPVFVVARILDEVTSGLTVEIHSRVDGDPVFQVTPMADDGMHNDGIAGDGTYGGMVSPQPDDTVVEFYLRATDEGGQIRAWPSASQSSGRLSGRWALDEGSGSLAADASGNGLTGVLTNGAAFVATGYIGDGAVRLSDANDYVLLEQDVSPPPLGLSSFTLATWFRRDAAGALARTGGTGVEAEPLIAKGRGEEDGNVKDTNFFLGLVPVGGGDDVVLAADFEEHSSSGNPGGNHPVEGTTVLGTGVWHHAAATYDGSTWTLYLDGVHEASLAAGGTPNYESIQPAALGTALDSTGVAEGAFIGLMDEVVIASGAMTPAQVATLVASNTYQPAPGAHQANLLYQVDDTQDPGDAIIHRLVMTEAERAELEDLGTNATEARSKAQMNGTFMQWDGRRHAVRYLVGIRNRGEGSRDDEPYNRRVNFRSDDPWQGSLAVNFNDMYTWVQVAGMAIFQRAGLPAPTALPAQLLVNNQDLAFAGSQMYGAYARVEVVDSDFADRHFPLDGNGNIYQGRRNWPSGTHAADLEYLGTDPTPYRVVYQKRTNTSEDDWTDLFGLCRALSADIPAALYPDEVRRRVHVEQWMRSLALHVLLGNRETNISTGDGDDYIMYRGVADPRFQLIPHDLDTILGQGDRSADPTRDLFEFAGLSVLDRMIDHPDFAPVYYHHLLDLLDGVLAPDAMESLLKRILDGHAPQAAIHSMLSFLDARRSHVHSVVPESLTVTAPGLAIQDGFPRTTDSVVNLAGVSHAARTRAIRVNGLNADWNAREATWQAAGIALAPGINRLTIEAVDEQGQAFESEVLDVWLDAGVGTPVAGTLTGGGDWIPAAGPYHLTGTVTVPSGQVLTIRPGTTILADAGASLLIQGTLMAEGTATQHIRFASSPGSGSSWNGIHFVDSPGTNRIAHTDMADASGGAESILVRRSTLHLEQVTWTGTLNTILELDDASVDVRHCIFPGIDNNDTVHGVGMPAHGYVIFSGNTFGPTTGYSDVIHFAGGQRPGPILQILDNVFLGGSDDGLDLDGADAHIEGNVFRNFHKNNTSDSSSNAIATGLGEGGDASEITVVRNLFISNDHAILVQEGGFLISQHNTYVDGALAAINFDEPNRDVAAGIGAHLDGDLFWGNAAVFDNVYVSDPVEGTTDLQASRCMLPTEHLGLGDANDDENPRLVDLPEDLHLGAGSPAIGTGAHGVDRGAYVAAGAAVSGAPASPTRATTATLTVGGPGVTHYRYRLNEGSFSAERTTAEPIVLTGLPEGTHVVEVVGKNSAGVWQAEEMAAATGAWTIDAGWARLILNEVLADQAKSVAVGGLYPDLVEIYNDSTTAMSLAGIGLSDRVDEPYRFSFPAGALLGAGEYLVVAAAPQAAGMYAAGFALARSGEGLYLSAAPSQGGGLLDSVVFGIQIPDFSIARGRDDQWRLATPSLGGPNTPVRTGDADPLLINEWLTNRETLYPADFLELYNPDPLPVALGGLHLTDWPGRWPGRYPIPPLSYIAGNGYTVFIADGDETAGANHLPFGLAADGGWLGLFDAALHEIDVIYYGAQDADVAEGRLPSGGETQGAFPLPSPGGPNPPGGLIQVMTDAMISITNSWRYHESRMDLGTAWRDPGYDDADWLTGDALFYVESSALPAPKNTPLTRGPDNDVTRTFYFRTPFVFAGNPGHDALRLTSVIDDGMVVYLNGQELFRLGMDSGPVSYSTLAGRSIGEAEYEGPFDVPSTALVTGTNLLAVEVHQTSLNSSDIVFGLALESSRTNFLGSVSLNEVLAYNTLAPDPGGALPDWVELASTGQADIDLGDMSLTDDLTLPRKWVIPAGTPLPANGYALIRCDSLAPVSPTNTGFGFDWEGDGVYLFDAPSRGGALVDGVTFGLQVPGVSLGRIPDRSGAWALNEFTPQSINVAAALGDPTTVRINEWMADPSSGEDWFELYNPGDLPIPLDGLYLTDDLQQRTVSGIPPRSFLAGGAFGYKKFIADGERSLGSHHVSFKLSRKGEDLGLFTADLLQVDGIRFGTQLEDVSEGRWPDGGTQQYAFPGTPTPQAPNQMRDDDLDGAGDLWENVYGDATLDPDGDGFMNHCEFQAGTDPLDPDSYLGFMSLASPGPALRASYDAVAGKQYILQLADDLAANDWVDVSPLPREPRSTRVDLTLPHSPDGKHPAFRLILAAPQE